MRKSTRIFILLGIVEVVFVVGAIWMTSQVTSGSWNAPDPGETISRIYSVTGAAIPIVAVLFGLIGFGLRRKGQ